jgi:hypothetical protein
MTKILTSTKKSTTSPNRSVFSYKSASLIIFWVIAWLLGNLQRFTSLGQLPIIWYGHDAIIITAVLAWAVNNQNFIIQSLKSLLTKSQNFSNWWWHVGLFFLVGGFAHGALIGENWWWGVLYLSRLNLYAAFIWLIVTVWWPASFGQIKNFSSTQQLNSNSLVQIITLIAAVLGYLQLWLIPDTRFLAVFGWDDHYFRFTLSRASWLAWLIAASLTLFAQWRYRAPQLPSTSLTITISLAVLATLILAWPKPTGEGGNLARTSTSQSRQTTLTQTLSQMSIIDWTIGRGLFVPTHLPATATVNKLPTTATQSDNLIIQIIWGTGLLGLGWIITTSIGLLKNWEPVQVIGLTPLTAVLVHAQFNNTLWQPFIWMLVCLISFNYLAAKKTQLKTN